VHLWRAPVACTCGVHIRINVIAIRCSGSLLLVDIEVKPSPGKQLLKQPP